VNPSLDVTAVIAAPPGRILRAFFDPGALNAWWQVAHAVTTPRMLGPYAIEWPATDFRDELLGRLGGVFRGTIIQFDSARGFVVADAFWLPPDGDPIGPMAIEVTCSRHTWGTQLHLRQSGYEEGARWRRYYEVIGPGWNRALGTLKKLAERGRVE
jgi:uncharacterized protein YndB with AHSA1/START domain